MAFREYHKGGALEGSKLFKACCAVEQSLIDPNDKVCPFEAFFLLVRNLQLTYVSPSSVVRERRPFNRPSGEPTFFDARC